MDFFKPFRTVAGKLANVTTVIVLLILAGFVAIVVGVVTLAGPGWGLVAGGVSAIVLALWLAAGLKAGVDG